MWDTRPEVGVGVEGTPPSPVSRVPRLAQINTSARTPGNGDRGVMPDFADKKVIVVGGSAGMGRQAAANVVEAEAVR